MSLFGVLTSEDGPTDYVVENLHINLWSLATLGRRRRRLVLDVGLKLTAGEVQLNRLSIAVPFGCAEMRCLYDKVTNPHTASLIFNSDVDVKGSSIEFAGTSLEAYRVAIQQSSRSASYASRGFSLWDVVLAKAIPARTTGYVRLRFPVNDAGDAWRWGRGRSRSTAQLDLRVADVRSAVSLKGAEELLERVVDVVQVDAFVILPAWLHARNLSPLPRYARLLEPLLWTRYLDRRAELRTHARLVVYSWRSATNSDAGEKLTVSPKRPFQVFGDLSDGAPASRLLTAVAGALIAAVLFGLLFAIPLQPWVLAAGEWVRRTVSEFWTAWVPSNPINILVLVGGMSAAVWGFGRSSLKWAVASRSLLLRAEEKLFKLLGGDAR